VQGGVTKALSGTTLADLVEFAGGPTEDLKGTSQRRSPIGAA
jgi:hypothetical protein